MNQFKLVIFIAAVGFLSLSAQAQTSQTNSLVTVTGFITDTLSGKRGANALHSEAAKRNVASGMAKYALYDEKTKKLYFLDQQDIAAANLGQRVTVTGALYLQPMQHAGQQVNPKTNEVEDFHTIGQDSTTPVAGVLTNFSVVLALPTASKPKPHSP